MRVPRGLAAWLLALLLPTCVARAQVPQPGSATAGPDGARTGDIENSVVKVFSTVRGPNLQRPWTKQRPRDISASGMVIEGHRILTSAHVVLYASEVQIQAGQAGDKISATVEAVAPGIGLAVLRLDDDSFFATHPALARAAALPLIKDSVLVYGFPTGGTSLAITKGIVSRIEFANYNYPVSGLRVQIDAAINPGNSGGPALVGDKVIGLAVSHLAHAENIGYIVPCEEIELFLKDIADGRYDGKPALYDDLQTLENPALRSFLKIAPSVHGMIVHRPYRTDRSYPLRTWDVITRIGDAAVDDQGMSQLNADLRIRFTYYVQRVARQGKVPLTIVRAGKVRTVQVPVSFDRPRLLPYLHGAYPSYFILGPMVFSVATEDLLEAIGNSTNGSRTLGALSNRGNPMVTRRSEQPAFPGEELVLMPCSLLPHKLSIGYGTTSLKVVKAVDGVPVKNLLHLVQILRDSKDEFITVEYATRTAETMVFPRKEALAATDGILADGGIRANGSPDVLAVWNAKAPR